MELQFSIKNAVMSIAGLLLFVLVIVAGFYHDGAGIVNQLWETATHFVAAAIGLAAVLGLLHISQRVRETHLFDRYGPAGEMKQVQNRIGTEQEAPADSISIAIRHAGTSVMIGLFFLAYFLAN